MRRAARVDANQAEIVKAIRKIGAEVTHLHTIGKGVADLLVSFRQKWFVLEVKDGAKCASARELTPDEEEWIGKQRAPVFVVTSPIEAVTFLQGVRP